MIQISFSSEQILPLIGPLSVGATLCYSRKGWDECCHLRPHKDREVASRTANPPDLEWLPWTMMRAGLLKS
jgi:hypothetical protein